MKMEKIYGVFFLFCIALGVYAEIKSKKDIKHAVARHNARLTYSPSKERLLNECFKDSMFLKLKNSGANPCEVNSIEFIKYSNEDDYYLK